jgi:hypothetical protein
MALPLAGLLSIHLITASSTEAMGKDTEVLVAVWVTAMAWAEVFVA